MAMVWGAVTVLCILSHGVGTDSLRKQLMIHIVFLPLLYQWVYPIRPIILFSSLHSRLGDTDVYLSPPVAYTEPFNVTKAKNESRG